MITHKFAVGQRVVVSSGKVYVVLGLRSDDHRKLKGEPGYNIVMLRNGERFGPVRLTRESNLRAEG